MLDRYWFGNVDRISPEAPVPIVQVRRTEHRPGGAANVARNAAALGADVVFISAVGDDEPGYEIEHREVDIGSSPFDLPAVVLRAPGSTLYLSSEPSGASISINGRKLSEVTPARIPLPPGTYNVTVEKNGKQSTQSVEVQNGRLNLLKIPLE
jgi:sugar/nucleoside kinase (ribokinase family)